ncbi:MAG: hypothetical protein ACYCTI_09595 [Acidimicrobiales bacterium]
MQLVNVRLSTAAEAHGVTQDIDLVTGDDTPTAVEVLSRANQLAREHTVVVKGIEVDIIETQAVTEEDLHGLDDDAMLFVAGHRWALETAGGLRVTTLGRALMPVELAVATPAGLVATKSHAAGYPRPARRATKHGGDLYDLFRLIEVFDTRGELRADLAGAPGGLGALVAQVVRREILDNPARAWRQMAPAASTALDVGRIVDVLEPFLATFA